MNKALTGKYDLRVPRYTSYPTAPHFTDAVDQNTYRQWLGELDPSTPLSLYFHIPFCDSMCWFCGCYTKIVNRYEPIQDYLTHLLKEIDLVAEALPARFHAKHLHWGGGSPTMLRGPDWKLILDKLRSHFDVDEASEVAVEIDPRDATEDYIRTIAEAGVNRASMGVQDFHQEVQEAINRIQPYDVTERVVNWLRKYGIEDINMDLIYGLPHQNLDRVREMVDLTVQLNPKRVALFGYAHVPWMKTHQKMIDEDTLPDTDARWDQATLAAERLQSHGYVAVGLDHFARPDDELAKAQDSGALHRNFQGYTTDDASVLMGFGASAIGFLPQGYVQNTSPLKNYKEAINAGEFPIARGIAFSAEDRLRGEVIERVMCDLAVDVKGIAEKHGKQLDYFKKELGELEPLAADGICTISNDGRITVSDDGRPFVRLVAAVFDTYLSLGKAQHSKAV